jgi:hypothetical protein
MTGVITDAPKTRTVAVATDLSAYAYHFVKYNTALDNTVVAAEDAAALPFVAQSDALDGSVTAGVMTIAFAGMTKLKLAGTVNPGAPIKPTTAGEGVVADTDGDFFGAVAAEGGVANDIIAVYAVQGIFKTP